MAVLNSFFRQNFKRHLKKVKPRIFRRQDKRTFEEHVENFGLSGEDKKYLLDELRKLFPDGIPRPFQSKIIFFFYYNRPQFITDIRQWLLRYDIYSLLGIIAIQLGKKEEYKSYFAALMQASFEDILSEGYFEHFIKEREAFEDSLENDIGFSSVKDITAYEEKFLSFTKDLELKATTAVWLSGYYCHMGEDKKALDILLSLEDAQITYPIYWFNLGSELMRNGNLGEAIEKFNIAIRLSDKEKHQIILSDIYYELARCFYEVKDYQKAVSCILKSRGFEKDKLYEIEKDLLFLKLLNALNLSDAREILPHTAVEVERLRETIGSVVIQRTGEQAKIIRQETKDEQLFLYFKYRLLLSLLAKIEELEKSHPAKEEDIDTANRERVKLHYYRKLTNMFEDFSRQNKVDLVEREEVFRRLFSGVDHTYEITLKILMRFGDRYSLADLQEGQADFNARFHRKRVTKLYESAMALYSEGNAVINLPRILFKLARYIEDSPFKFRTIFCYMIGIDMAEEYQLKETKAQGLYELGVLHEKQRFLNKKKALDFYMQAIIAAEELLKETAKAPWQEEGDNFIYFKVIALACELNMPSIAIVYIEKVTSRTLNSRMRTFLLPKTTECKNLWQEWKTLSEALRELDKKMFSPKIFDDKATLLKTIDTRRQLRVKIKDALEQINKEEPHFISSVFESELGSEGSAAQIVKKFNGVMIGYFYTQTELFIFVLTGSQENLFIKINTNIVNLLGGIRTFVRGYLQNPEEFPEKVAMMANRIYQSLFPPQVGNLIQKYIGKNLIIVPYKYMGNLPFGALHDGSSYLLEKYNISYVPNMQLLKTCIDILEERSSSDKTEYRVFSTPEVEEEGTAVSDILANLSYKGKHIKNATIEEFIDGFSKCDIAHLSTHARLDEENIFNSFILFSDKTQTGDTAKFFPQDMVNRLNFNGKLVVLSACQTSVDQISSGYEMRSFSKVFFYVGAPAIIATMWQVESEATKIIMKSFYGNLQKRLTVAHSLKKAQCDLLTNYPAYAHPYYFSPFICLGNPF